MSAALKRGRVVKTEKTEVVIQQPSTPSHRVKAARRAQSKRAGDDQEVSLSAGGPIAAAGLLTAAQQRAITSPLGYQQK
eukprot:UN10767